jgi:outer membrane protein TolC
MKKLIFALVLSLNAAFVFSQTQQKQFTEDAFLFYVKKFHPIAKQAKILIDKANAEILSSRGGFDPILYSYLDEKNFTDKNYYSLLDAGLKIPTWYGLEFKTSFNQNSGNYLNPDNELPYNGLFQAGVNISLLQGMVIDERRAALSTAKVMLSYSTAEQELLLNDLILEAITTYWQWVKDYQQLNIKQQAAKLAFDRFNSLKGSYEQGDLPAIDTLESYMQYQLRLYNTFEAQQNLQESRLKMSTYLWYENNQPLEITDSLLAPDLTQAALIGKVDSLIGNTTMISSNHPFLKQYDFKIKALEIDRKLKVEKLKPKLNVNYNLINEPLNPIPFDGLNMQNTKWGLSFSYPIFIRKERGDLKIAGLKIIETDLSRELKRYDLNNKLNAVIFEQNNLRNQITVYRSLVENFQRMLNAEVDKFNNGESSVFLINSREINLIQAQISFVNINAKYQTLYYKRKWIEGTLFQ